MKKKIFYDQNFNNYCVYVFSYGRNSLYIDVAAKGRYATLLSNFTYTGKVTVYCILENVDKEKALYTVKLLNIINNTSFRRRIILNYIKRQLMLKFVKTISGRRNNPNNQLLNFPNKTLLIILGDSANAYKKVCMMNDLELYERSRFCWKINNLKQKNQKEELNKGKYVFVIYKEHIIEVYKNIKWYNANSKQMFSRKQENSKDRFEFVGKIDTKLSKQYMGKYFKYYTRGGVYKTW